MIFKVLSEIYFRCHKLTRDSSTKKLRIPRTTSYCYVSEREKEFKSRYFSHIILFFSCHHSEYQYLKSNKHDNFSHMTLNQAHTIIFAALQRCTMVEQMSESGLNDSILNLSSLYSLYQY